VRIAESELWRRSDLDLQIDDYTGMSGATDYGVGGTQNVQPVTVTDCKLYKRRWPMLLLFVLCSMANAVQWIQYSIISNVIMKFYDVSSFAVDFTSIVYMVSYIPLIFPASWILDRMVRSAQFNVLFYIQPELKLRPNRLG